MAIRRHRRSWQVRLPNEPARSFPTKPAAEKYELHRKLARSLGDLHQEPPITVTEMLNGCLERWQVSKQPAPGTVQRAREAVGFWERSELADQLLVHVRLVEVEDTIFCRAAEYPNAAKKELEWFKRGLRDAQRRGQRFDATLLLIDPIRSTSRQGIALDTDELERLGSWFPEHLARFPEIVGSTGMRLGEALTLEDDRVDVQAGMVFIPADLCKERRDKLIELADFERVLMAEHLVARPPGTSFVFPRAGGGRYKPGPWDKADFYARVWYPARAAAGRELREVRGLPEWQETKFDTLVPHDLRHTAIS